MAHKIKTNVLTVYPTGQKEAKISLLGNTGGTSADWNVNNPKDPSYIKNRPFYVGEPKEEAVFSNRAKGSSNGIFIDVNIPGALEILKETIKVSLDGEVYQLTKRIQNENGVEIFAYGNLSLAGMGEDTGEDATFLAARLQSDDSIIQVGFVSKTMSPDPKEYLVEIYGKIEPIVKIPEKFIDYKPGIITKENGEVFNSKSNKAQGLFSHAEGCFTIAKGNFSHVEGGGGELQQDLLVKDFEYVSNTDDTLVIAGDHWQELQGIVYILYQNSSDFSCCIHVETKNLIDGNTAIKAMNHVSSPLLGGASGKMFECTLITDSNGGISIGQNSHTEGFLSFSIGNSSHAEGCRVVAAGLYSHAEGEHSDAFGESSHAEGYYATTSGYHSHAEGCGTKANGDNSHAEGYYATASGNCSHAEGGSTTASGNSSHAEGADTTASGDRAHAEGDHTIASGDYSHAEGFTTTASDFGAHAEGSGTTASSSSSHAEGTGTTASGDQSHAEGDHTTASGNCSHAEGLNSIAAGGMSHAEGCGTIASAFSPKSHVEGQYNIEDKTGTYAHIVGNGEAGHRANAHTLDWSGNAWFKGDIKVGGQGYSDQMASTVLTTKTKINSFVFVDTNTQKKYVLFVQDGKLNLTPVSG